MTDIRPAWRVPLLILGFVALWMGVGAGLMRLGWRFPLPSPALMAMHAPLMVSGFFGTVISMERAVALARRWAYLGPLGAGLGALAIVVGAPLWVGQGLLALGSAVLVAASIAIFARQRALFTFTLASGAGFWFAGNVAWLGGASVQGVVPCWIAFLTTTIAGERLELSRLRGPSPAATRAFGVVLAAIALGVVASLVFARAGICVLAGALLALAIWLARHDVARRTIHGRGLPRFVATCLLIGYAWLAVGCAIFVAAGAAPGTGGYDAGVHALMLGFVFSMVLGHAPVIVPAVFRVSVPYHRALYVPLVLLHASLALRVAGDGVGSFAWRRDGGLLNAAALLAFVLGTVLAIVRGKQA